MKYILLDTSILIGAFDTDFNNEQHLQDRQLVSELLQDESVKIAITPLIRHEVLQGIQNIDFDEMKDILDDFMEFNINDEVANQTARIFHFSRSDEFIALNLGIKLNKQKFDLFHYVVAKNRDLELISSNQKDFSKIDKVVNAMPINPFE
ncbi:MAG: PIN domain-containing protein [Moraxella sp.]|nr:PIN domain-containing protein [Moraxella sp.]